MVVTAKKKIDPRTCSFQRTNWWRNIDLEIFEATCGFGAVEDCCPDTWSVHHFALAVFCSAARPVAHIFRAGLRAHVFHLSQNAIPASLTTEKWRLDDEFEALHSAGNEGLLVHPTEQIHQKVPQVAFLVDGKHST